MIGARRLAALALAALAALPAARAGDGDPPAPAAPSPAPPRSGAFVAAVRGAIDRGVAFLRRLQRSDGAFEVRPIRNFVVDGTDGLGATALALYTLRACGVAREDPDVRRGFQRLREMWESARRRRGGLDNYGVALTVLALEAHHAPEEAASPGDRYAPPADSRRVPGEDREWMRALTRWLLDAQTRRGGFGYVAPAQGEVADHSNGQFSLLALKAARRCGIDVPPEAFRRSLDHWLDAQERRGPLVPRFEPVGGATGYGEGAPREAGRDRARGWGYRAGTPATGSMTAGGVSSLVICRSEIRGTPLCDDALDRRTVTAIRDGLAWLGAAFTVEGNPGPPGAPALRELWHYYYLYGVERAGVLAGVTLLGSHDWYLEGGTFLLDAQRDNGSWLGQAALDAVPWKGAGPDAATANFLDTCFALLFLKRATFRVAEGAVTTEPTLGGLVLEGATDLDEGAFRDLFDAVLSRYRGTPAAGRAARREDFLRLGIRAIPLLLLRLDAAEEGERALAFEALRGTTGRGEGYDPAAPAEARAAALACWERWWFENRARLEADLAGGRFTTR